MLDVGTRREFQSGAALVKVRHHAGEFLPDEGLDQRPLVHGIAGLGDPTQIILEFLRDHRRSHLLELIECLQYFLQIFHLLRRRRQPPPTSLPRFLSIIPIVCQRDAPRKNPRNLKRISRGIHTRETTKNQKRKLANTPTTKQQQ